MSITERMVQTKNYVTKSSLPDSDFVINPYIGCTHACKYCYACFMKRFTNHKEKWGTFIDVKQCDKKINVKQIKNKSIFLASVTDCYNPYEKKYKVTQGILEQLKDVDCSVTISTKSNLILRDIEQLKQLRKLKVAISINTLDEKFQKDMDCASSISERLFALKELYRQDIYTVLFISPIFPFVTDFKEIITKTSNYVDEYWFENLNLRGGYKQPILSYIAENYPQFIEDYKEIYNDKKLDYWSYLSSDIESFCKENNVKYKNYFYHKLLVATKKKKEMG